MPALTRKSFLWEAILGLVAIGVISSPAIVAGLLPFPYGMAALLPSFLALPIVLLFLLCRIEEYLEELRPSSVTHSPAALDRLLAMKRLGELLGNPAHLRVS